MKNRTKRTAVFAAVCMATALFAGSAFAEGTFVLGVQEPLSGDNAVAGQIAVNAIKLYADIANENGGWNGEQIELAVYDDQSSQEEAVKVANKLAQVDKANAVIGSLLSSNVLASAGFLDEAGIVTLGIGTSPSWMQQGWEYVFRACHNGDLVLPSLADKMEELGMKTVAVFHGEDDSSMTGFEPMVDIWAEKGIEMVRETNYTTGDTDFSGQIASMLDAEPDCIYLSTQGTVLGSFMKQLRSFGYEGLVFSKELMTTDQLEVAGDDADGYIFASAYVTYATADEIDDPQLKEMYELYYDAYGEYPAHDCAFRAWDSMLVLDEAVKIAGSTESDAIKEAIGQITGLDTLAGTADYTDGTREALSVVNCFAAEGEKYIPIADFDASAYIG